MSRRALLMATNQYADPQIANLRAPVTDAQGLHEVLADPRIGGFNVNACVDATEQQWRQVIGDFFLGGTREDLLLLYVSGHGVKDQAGKLYFAAADTRLDKLISTGVAAAFIQEAAHTSRSNRVLLIFDTCFSGAFARGFQHRGAAATISAGEYFRDTTGTVVMTASDALQYALEEDSVKNIGQPSVFTRHLIQGLKTGEADKDGDGQITSEDLYKYVVDKVRAETQTQRPQRWAFGLDRDIVVAANPHPRPAPLPADLLELMQNPRPEMKLRAILDLAALAESSSMPITLAAREALRRLAADANPIVSSGARGALGQPGAAPARRSDSGPAGPDDPTLAARRAEPSRAQTAEKRAAQDPAARNAQQQTEPPRTAESARPEDPAARQLPSDPKERSIARLAHLSAFAMIIAVLAFKTSYVVFPAQLAGALIILVMYRRRSPYVTYHAREALNFNITMSILFFAGVTLFPTVWMPLLSIPVLVWFVQTLVAALKAHHGIEHRYPFTLRLIPEQAS